MAPISLAILNPIGYVLMEISKMQAAQQQQQIAATDDAEPMRRGSVCPQLAEREENAAARASRKSALIMKTIRSILFNPILFMTVLGVIGGVAFPNGLPVMMSGVLRVFGNSFSATALFLLGLRMLGTGTETQRPGFLTPCVLILVKLLVLPLVNRQMVNLMQAGANVSDTTDLSTYAFLYGTFPSAPGVFVIATQYQTDIDLIATSMVACTFISGPLMFISAKMISLTNLNPADYLHELDNFALDISCVGMVACVWVLLLFGLTKRFKRMPQRVTCCLVVSQFVFCIGIVMWATLGSQKGWFMYLQFALFTIGSYSSRLWTAILAISMLFLQCRSLCFVLKLWPWFVSTYTKSYILHIEKVVCILEINAIGLRLIGLHRLGSADTAGVRLADHRLQQHFAGRETQSELSVWQRTGGDFRIPAGHLLHRNGWLSGVAPALQEALRTLHDAFEGGVHGYE